MQKELICEFFIFDLHQRIMVFDPETRKSECIAITELKDLPKVISQISNDKQIYNIHLLGNKNYGENLKENILAYNAKHYSKNKIKVEVN